MSKTKLPQGIVNPFSDEFLPTWDLWKSFRLEEHNFKYKGVISEQMALKRLVTVSDGDEQKAVRIVEQSISRGWMDFYQLKQSNPNGQSKRKSGQPAGASGSLRERVLRATSKKFGNGEGNGSESYSKAV